MPMAAAWMNSPPSRLRSHRGEAAGSRPAPSPSGPDAVGRQVLRIGFGHRQDLRSVRVSHESDEALFAPAAARNGGAILDVLRHALPHHGCVLELASGSGEHAVRFAAGLPDLRWQPSDPDSRALRSIAAHARTAGLPNLLPPIELDVRAQPWPPVQADAMVCINMIHIAPWSATEGLMAGAGRLLGQGGPLVLYGPFRIDGAHTAASTLR